MTLETNYLDNYADDGNLSNSRTLTQQEKKEVELAEKCGLVFGGVGDEGQLEFIGEKEDFERFESEKESREQVEIDLMDRRSKSYLKYA
jgi:hypothetical protein